MNETDTDQALAGRGSFRYWSAIVGRAGEVHAEQNPSWPRSTGDTLIVVADPIAEALLGDLPHVAVPTAGEMLGGDDRRIWAWSGSPFHWLPGIDGHPGRPPQRLLRLDDAGVRLAVDTGLCPPTVLDHLRAPVYRHIAGLPGLTGPVGFTSHTIDGGPGSGPRSWRQSVRDACQGSDLIALDPTHCRSGAEAAFVVACAGAFGIPTWVQRWTSELIDRLHPDLVDELRALDPDRLQQDPYYRDLVGVRVRRHVLEHHSETSVWRDLAPEGDSSSLPAVLVMVSSIRPECLPQVVEYLNRQTYANFRTSVVVDRVELAEEVVQDCMAAAEFGISITTNRLPLTVGEIYNQMMRESDADIAVIWDDDDHYAPEHLQDLVQALVFSHATIAGKWAEFFHLGGPDITIQRSPELRYSDTPLIGGSNLAMWRSTVLGLGGFMPTTLGYDQELIERVRSRGGKTYRTHGYGYLATRRSSGHTWNPGDGYFLEQSVRQWPGLMLDAASFDSPDKVVSGKRYR